MDRVLFIFDSSLELNTYVFGLISFIAIFVVLYVLYVEHRLKTAKPEDNYKAVCDINDRISCSKVLSSKYAKGFGIFNQDSIFNVSNAAYGILFYALILTLLIISSLVQGINVWITYLLVVLLVIANLGDIYLAYILFFKLKDICIVCCTLYFINALLFAISIWRAIVLPSGNKANLVINFQN